ncbi:laminin subunit alpha-3 [Colossoma macropomum]|uniref:laminin subunit alpha-3 n=1 Tax=Colossoma macropomum TaxID=42526 RepID=UPI0018644F82|nr:laminin subunit alpha-3 [Colossoma macropomum]
MSCVWGFLFCCMAGLWLCVADQGTPSSQVRYRHSAEHRPQRSSRKHCDPTYNNHTAGAITQQCGPGQYKEKRGPYRGRCEPCNCNGLSHECDPNTGKCRNCQLNTAGDHCERCVEGYYGSAALRTCQVCPCPFSDPSHSFALGCLRVGDQFECLCKPGYLGTRCERCAAGYYGNPLQGGGSCQLCACDDGYLCDPFTGECENPNNPSTDGDCQECDSCVQTLMEDLEGMDSELYKLKVDLERFKNSSDSLAALRKLEEAINATKVLVMKYNISVQLLEPKVKELETDVDGVRNDLRKLKAKADLTSSVTNEVLKDLDKTQQKGEDLLTDTEELLRRIEELLEQLKLSNITVPSKEVARMLEEARQMVAQMRRQNCNVQRRLAEDELEEAQRLLDYIMENLSDPLNGTLSTAERIARDLMSRMAELKDLEEALKKAERTVNETKVMNDRSEATLSDILKRRKMLEEEQEAMSADVVISKGTLREITDVLMMMEDLKNNFAELGAELDRAEVGLKQKLDELSRATAKEGIVREAEEHAQYLMDLAMHFQMSLLNYTNTSAVHKAVEAINAYGEIIDALKKAEAAANEAHKAADQALANVKAQNLTQKAEELKNAAISLLDKAEKAERNLTEATQKYAAIKDRLDKAKAEGKSKNKEVQAVEEMLNEIHRDDIDALVNQAKDAVQAANNTVSNATARLKDISDEVDKIRVPGGDSNVDDILNSINKTLNELNKVFPELTDTLAEVENQSSRVPTRTNMSDSIMRIKDMIEKTRDMANRIRGPILFSGNSHIELRPPKNLEDLRAFTALNLTLHRPKLHQRRRRQSAEEEDNLFVLYLGNKNTQKDYVGMVVKNGVLYCVYKLGGVLHEIKTSKITESSTNSSFMDRVDFRRVYQDAEVVYTKTFTSSAPTKLPPMTNQANTTVSLLDLDRNEVVLYVGGYPNDFTPPKELKYPNFRGCIEFSTLNEHILGLYNFQNAVNIKNTDRCLRGEVRQVGQYFDGTGYGRVNMAGTSRTVKFFLLSRQKNALLFFMGKKDAHFTVTMEEGFVVLRIRKENQTRTEKSNRNIFPAEYYKQIRIFQSPTDPRVDVTDTSVLVRIDYLSLQSAETEAFIGGVPVATAVRHNISYPPFRGCLKSLEVDVFVRFIEEVGIVPGCPVDLLGLREASLEMGDSLSFAPNIIQSNEGAMVSLGFKSTQSSGLLLNTGNMDSGFELSLVGGHVEMTDSANILKSKNRYDEGGWHYVTAFRNSTGMELSIDNSDIGEKQAPASATAPTGVDIVLGQETFQGCLRNFYMRRLEDTYIPADLSSFNQTGLVSLGSCKAQHPPLSMTEKSSFKRRGTVNWPNVQKDSFQPDCIKPAGLIQAYHLSTRSQLQYPIQPEDLNFRPHFSLDVRTRSANGLLLHIADQQGVSRVVLFIASGSVKLSVGEGGLLHYQKKINNGEWHNIRFSVEQHTAHLVVDGFRVPDGQLQQDEGISMGLQAPVYIGSGQVQTVARTQGKPLPKKSVIGCIRDVRFYDVLVGEPAVNRGGAPCFNGAAVEGAYFAGDGSYAVLEKHIMLGTKFNLTFEVRPRNVTGLLFHCRGHHGHSLSVFLKKAKMVVQMNDGAGDYGTSVTPPSPLCDHTFHHVKVTKNGNSIKLTVGKDSNSAVGPSVHYDSQAHDTLYIGGAPEKKRRRVPVWSSFVGCMRNVQINQAAVSFESITSIFGPVNTNECPGD